MAELKKSLNFLEATIYGVGVVIGVGIYSLLGRAAGLAGNLVWASFLLGAAIATFTGLSYAELSSIFPKAAANYYYISRAFNSRFLAFLFSWLLIFANLMGISTVAIGFGGYLSRLIPTPPFLNAFLLILALFVINLRGIKPSVKFNSACVVGTIVGILTVIAFGLPKLGSIDYFYSPYGIHGVLTASTLIFFAFLGFENVASLAEETKNPKHNIPRAILSSIAITTILYVLVAISAVSLADWRELATSDTPLALALSKVSNISELLVTLLALAATASTCLGLMIYVSRIIYGVAKDGSLPEIFTLVHPKYGTPWVAIYVATIFSCLFLLVGNPAVSASLATFSSLLAFVSVNIAVIWLRKENVRGRFRIPLNVNNIPITSLLGAFLCAFLLLQFSIETIKIGIWVVLAAVFYSFILDRLLKWLEVWENLKRMLTRFQKEFLSD